MLRHAHESQSRQLLLGLGGRETLEVGDVDRICLRGDGEIDHGTRLHLGIGLGILADDHALRHRVALFELDATDLEPRLTQGVSGILLRVAHDIGNRHRTAKETGGVGDEEADARDEDDGDHGEDDVALRVVAFGRYGTSPGTRHHGGLARIGHHGGLVDAVWDGGPGNSRIAAVEHLGFGGGTTRQIVVDGTLHFLGGRKAVVGVLLQRRHDDGLELRVDVGIDLARRDGKVAHLLHGYRYHIRAIKGQLARRGLVEHDAERVEVACRRELLALSLLRTHVVRGAQHRGVLGHAGVPGLGDAEVHDLHVTVALHHDVR